MKKELKQIHEGLQEKYGNAIMPIGTKQIIKRTETGIIGLDYVTGGGIPEKSAVEFWGKEQSCKTTFSYKIIAYYQRQGKSCAHIDSEHNFDDDWARANGVDVENLLKIKAGTLEEAGNIIVDLTLQNIDLIIVDSIIALIPEQELERDLDEPQRASQARVIAPMTRKLNEALLRSTTSYLFVNQIRIRMDKYGSPYKTAGGRALLHFYRIRVEFKATGFIEIKDERKYPGKKKGAKIRIGQEVRLLANKNQTCPPYKKATIDFYYKDGKLDNIKSLIYSCVKYGVIGMKGSYYSYGKVTKQGIDKFKKYIDDKVLYEELKEKLWEKLMFKKQ